jgi:glycerophosphoryl diester phosphodiesterase
MTRINAQVYFASYEIVTSELLAALNIANIPLITWTVNRSEDMDTMIRMGVQRILTDYPQILSKKIKPNPFHP